MRVEFLLLCDAAQIAEGKLNLLGGGWGVYRVPAFPAQMDMSIVISLLTDRQEMNVERAVKLEFLTDDDAVIGAVDVTVGVGMPVVPDTEQRVMVPAKVGLVVPRTGHYRARATVQSKSGEVGFDVVPIGTTVAVTQH